MYQSASKASTIGWNIFWCVCGRVTCIAMIITVHNQLTFVATSLLLMVEAVVVLREQHVSGPSAISAGKSCLHELSKAYFRTTSRGHIPNLAIIFLHGLSSPAAEISEEYLKWVHEYSMMADAEK